MTKRIGKTLRLCCGCAKRAEGLQTGDPAASHFGLNTLFWGNIFVPQDVEGTNKNILEAGGAPTIASKLGTDLTAGIPGDATDLLRRREQFGENRFPEPLMHSWYYFFFESLKDLILIILVVAAVISMTVGGIEDPGHGWMDGLAILFAVIIVGSVTASNDFSKQLKFAELSKESAGAVEIRVVRGGAETTVGPEDVLVGDLIKIDTGAKLPADGLLLRGDIKTNESALTGESDEIRKNPETAPVLLSGTYVTAGTGLYLVTAIGTRSLQGQIMKETASEEEETPLQKKLDKLATRIGYLGMTCALVTFLALIIIKATGGAALRSWSSWAIAALIYAITIAVVAVPEGLPLAVTISLAYSTKKMLADKSLVRHLDACETMGNATDICTDKTGTLTENRMTVVQAWLAGEHVTFSSSSPAAKITKPGALRGDIKELLRAHLALNSTASVVGVVSKAAAAAAAASASGAGTGAATAHTAVAVAAAPVGAPGTAGTAAVAAVAPREVKGSKTEGAGLLLVQDMGGANYEDVRHDAGGSGALLKQVPFSSERKMMSTITMLPDGRVRVFVTGGSDFVLARCTFIAAAGPGGVAISPVDAAPVAPSAATGGGLPTADLPTSHLTDAQKAGIMAGPITAMASESLRTLALAYRDFPSRALTPAHFLAVSAEDEAAAAADAAAAAAAAGMPVESTQLENGLTLYGILGIKDPLRAGVPEAVEKATRAGVRVRMVTGDNIVTATAIARECGILRYETDVVMEGPMFRSLTPEQLDMILPRLAVLARSSPADKMILVRRLNGSLPRGKVEWEKEHSPKGLTWEEHRETTLPGYYEEWAARRSTAAGLFKAVVGVTGDGTNDAPALKYSDVGLAMGIAGTEVAKEACDIIITDDNFASIIDAIKWGRSVYDNVRSFLQFQLTVNVVALLITFVTAVMQEQPPMNPIMLLWVNLIMDTLGALALATQTPSESLLGRKPYSSEAFLLSARMWRHVLVQAAFQFITLIVLFTQVKRRFGITPQWLDSNGHYLTEGGATAEDVDWYRSTFIFNVFVWCTVLNEFNSRSLDDSWNVLRGLHRDRAFIGVILVSVVLQVLISEFGGSFTKTTGLTPLHWVYSALIALITIPLGVAMRFIPVPDRPADFADFFANSFAQRMATELARSPAAAALLPILGGAGKHTAAAKAPAMSGGTGVGEAAALRLGRISAHVVPSAAAGEESPAATNPIVAAPSPVPVTPGGVAVTA